MSRVNIPDLMTAVVLDSYSGVEALQVGQRTVPMPGDNEVLVKVAATPINPYDIYFIDGQYAFQKPTPVVPGLEGSGTVVAVGGGLMARYLNGKRVACVGHDKDDGVWAEYVRTTTNLVLPLDKSVSLEQGAMSIVNPLTAIAFLTIAKKDKHKAIVQTAAASALGQMVNRLCQSDEILVINIVRRESQAELLKKQGVKIILNSNASNFDHQLHHACHQHNSRLAFDAVAGPMTMQLLEAMPPHSKVTVYGRLSDSPAQADPDQLYFQNKVVDGFWLTTWIAQYNLFQILMIWRRAQKLISTDLKSNIRAQHPLHKAQDAVREYQNQMTGGKILLRPDW